MLCILYKLFIILLGVWSRVVVVLGDFEMFKLFEIIFYTIIHQAN